MTKIAWNKAIVAFMERLYVAINVTPFNRHAV